MSAPTIQACTSVFLLRSVHTGKGICIGFTKETPPNLPEGDVIHMCLLSKENIELKAEEMLCHPSNRISCTLDEAEKIGISFIRTATLYKAGVKKDDS